MWTGSSDEWTGGANGEVKSSFKARTETYWKTGYHSGVNKGI